MSEHGTPARVRLDKWLWAARFFKTRSLAKQAIEGGKVYYEGSRVKVSRDVQVGATLRIRQGFDEKMVRVTALSDQRRGAAEAAMLYEETPESIAARGRAAEQRRLLRAADGEPPGRPSKRDRRLIHRFKEQQRGA